MSKPEERAAAPKKKRPVGNIISSAVTVLMLIVIAFLAYSLLAGAREGRSVGIGGYKLLAVLTGSMEPEISQGDLIIVKRVERDELSVGDIATFSLVEHGPSVFLTHRIVAIDGDGYITKGDANNVNDTGRKTYQQVEGKYVLKISGLGTVLVFLSSPKGLVLAGIIFAAYVLIEALVKFILKEN